MLTPGLMKQALVNAHEECTKTASDKLAPELPHGCVHVNALIDDPKTYQLWLEHITAQLQRGDIEGMAFHFLHVGYALARLEAGLITAPSEPVVDKSKPMVIQKEGAA